MRLFACVQVMLMWLHAPSVDKASVVRLFKSLSSTHKKLEGAVALLYVRWREGSTMSAAFAGFWSGGADGVLVTKAAVGFSVEDGAVYFSRGCSLWGDLVFVGGRFSSGKTEGRMMIEKDENHIERFVS